ncbi:MAG: Ldh family oxidoreductase [Candidatus Poribacteria bacterium]|nr:Ldh family oxidoreductase [Candidatus Poribacteria bacterium]
MPIFTEMRLTQICLKMLQSVGVSNAEAEIVTKSMIDANLVGHDSHGIIHLPKYIQGIIDSSIRLDAKVETERESPSIAVLNGNWGLGPVIATRAMELAVQKAGQTDISSVAVRNCNEVGRLGGYGLVATEQKMISIISVNDHGSGQCVVPHGGIEARLSTNPIVYAIPVVGQEPIILDMSTSVVASGKVQIKKNRGESVPEGWIIDAEGNPTTNVDDFYGPPPGALLPLGGIASHKGFGLSLIVDILSGALGGGGCSREGASRIGNGFFVITIKVGSFTDFSTFSQEVDRFIKYVKSAQKSSGVEEIYIPGERGFRERDQRYRNGIFIEEETWGQIQATAEECQVRID